MIKHIYLPTPPPDDINKHPGAAEVMLLPQALIAVRTQKQ